MSEVLELYFNADNIKLAFNRVNCWSDKMIKDRFGLRAFGYDLEKNCEDLSLKILSGKYKPQTSFKFYMPKASKTQRTKTLLMVEDAIVYQAIANVIGQKSYHKLRDHENFVFGSVLNPEVALGTEILDQEQPNYFFFKFWKGLYQKFKDSVISSIKEDKVKYKFETDITGFFDSIPHYNLLLALSTEFEVEDEILDMLSDCLNVWSGTKDNKTPGVGIPQGPQPSFLFANLLLNSLDDKMVSNGLKYYRYMDDIKIYGYEERELLEALVTIDSYTKSHGLSINSKKTSIEEIDHEKEDATIKSLKKMDLFGLYESEAEISSGLFGSDDNPDVLIDRDILFLSEQGSDGDSCLINSVTSTIDDPEEIVSFWKQNIAEVEKQLPELVILIKEGEWEIANKDETDDIDFIRLSAKYGTSFAALRELEIIVEPDESLLPIWLFIMKKYFWRANIFGSTVMLYKNNEALKAELINAYKGDLRLYEWVRYSLITTLAISQKFDDRELRTCFYKFLREEESDLVKIALYRLLFNHSTNNQFRDSLRKELQKEQNNYLRVVVMDFVRSRDINRMFMTELLQSIAI